MSKKHWSSFYLILFLFLCFIIILLLLYNNNKKKKSVVKNPTNFTIVTGFYDIGRSEWQGFSRKTELYINSFKKYLVYPYKIVVFLDDRYTNQIPSDPYCDLTVVPINKEWLLKNAKTWHSMQRVKDIMALDRYKTLVKKRIEINLPENTIPEYNLIVNSKIDFINYAIDNGMVDTEYVVWSDFGYFNSVFGDDPLNYPPCPISIESLQADNDKLNFWLYLPIEEEDSDLIKTLVDSRNTFATGAFTGSVPRMKDLYRMAHEVLAEMYENGVSDDDQHVYLRCYFANPSIFKLHRDEVNVAWPSTIKDGQKQYNTKQDMINDFMLYRSKDKSHNITSTSTVVNHSDDCELLICESDCDDNQAFNMLKKGGILFLTTPNQNSSLVNFKDGSSMGVRIKYF